MRKAGVRRRRAPPPARRYWLSEWWGWRRTGGPGGFWEDAEPGWFVMDGGRLGRLAKAGRKSEHLGPTHVSAGGRQCWEMEEEA